MTAPTDRSRLLAELDVELKSLRYMLPHVAPAVRVPLEQSLRGAELRHQRLVEIEDREALPEGVKQASPRDGAP